MTPASFAILTLAALVIVSQIVKIAFDVADGDNRYQFTDNKTPSGIA